MPKQKKPIYADAIIVHTSTGDRPLSMVLHNILNGIPPDCERYRLDDVGYGNLFADIYRQEVRHVDERNCWYVYDGTCWSKNDKVAMEKCKRMTRAVSDYLLQNLTFRSGNDGQKQFANLTSRRSRETVLKDASSVYPIHVSDFDRDPMLFNCLNGTLDLNTYTLRPHDPDDLLTKVADVSYEPSAICDRWIQHIREVTEGDDELAVYLQKAASLCLTGSNPYECFFLLYGPSTRNGKSTTMETIMAMMGDYAMTSNPETIAQKQTYNGGGPSENVARLAGARLVNIPEPDKKLVLSAALVKTLTGNDTITARYLHENSFEFKPTFKLFINTNYLPRIPDLTVFKSGRVKVIPFNHYFDEGSQDKNLKATLIQPQNRSGILNWLIEGLRLLRTQGFAEPQAVIDATADYRQDSDKISQFLEECAYITPGVNARMADVYKAYQSWCVENGTHAQSLPNFRKDLEDHVTIGRSRFVGGDKLSNAVACVFDLTLDAGYIITPGAPVVPLSDDAATAACKQAGYDLTFSANPNADNLAEPQTRTSGNSNA